MSFLSGNALSTRLRAVLGAQFKPERIKQAAYELSLGSETFRTDAKNGKTETLDDSKNKTIEINPGQFALLMTEEAVEIPNDLLAFISIKAGEKLKGLINVSGFHVDPGFKGKLLFSVYNAGPSTITLQKGKQYFLFWLAEISEALPDNKKYNSNDNNHQDQDDIDLKYVDALKRGELASPNVLLEKINELNHMKSRNQWLLTFIFVLIAGTVYKMYWDWDSYYKGKVDGLKEKSSLEFHKSQIENYDLSKDSVFVDKLTSLIEQKIDSTVLELKVATEKEE